MNCPDANTWNLLSMGLLDEARSESLREHCKECERCRTAWEEALGQHSELVDAFEAFDCDHDRQREQLMAMLDRPAPDAGAVPGRTWLGGIAMSMRKHKTRWATAALVPAACVLFAVVMLTGEKTVFADMLEKVRQARTMQCDVVSTTTVVEGQLSEIMKTPWHGAVSMHVDGDKRAMLFEMEQMGVKTRSLYLGNKTYVWSQDAVREYDTTNQTQSAGNPADLLNQLLQVRESPDRRLGEETIAGRRAVGYEVATWEMAAPVKSSMGDPESRLRVWVDVEKDLPIRMEIEQPMVMPGLKAKICSRWDNIQWDVALNAKDFRPPAKEEITKSETIQVPTPDEATFIEAMRGCLELKDKAQAGAKAIEEKAKEKGEGMPAEVLTLVNMAALDSGYPERLDQTWLSGVFSGRAALVMIGEQLANMKPISKDLAPEERKKLIQSRSKESAMAGAQASVKAMLKATAVAGFYQKLVREKREPEYFGATVKPGDKEAVLLRWKLDDGGHRVIYGDLSVGNVASTEKDSNRENAEKE